jgi:multiple sugar transport system permease protein
VYQGLLMSVTAIDTSVARPRFTERRSTRKAVLIWSFLAPSLLIFLLYRILPLGWNVLLSFEAWSPLKPAVFIGFDNYQEMFSDDDVFWQALWNTLGIIASAPVGIAIALGLAPRQFQHPRPRRLSHRDLPVLSAHHGRGSDHLALDVR